MENNLKFYTMGTILDPKLTKNARR